MSRNLLQSCCANKQSRRRHRRRSKQAATAAAAGRGSIPLRVIHAAVAHRWHADVPWSLRPPALSRARAEASPGRAWTGRVLWGAVARAQHRGEHTGVAWVRRRRTQRRAYFAQRIGRAEVLGCPGGVERVVRAQLVCLRCVLVAEVPRRRPCRRPRAPQRWPDGLREQDAGHRNAAHHLPPPPRRCAPAPHRRGTVLVPVPVRACCPRPPSSGTADGLFQRASGRAGGRGLI